MRTILAMCVALSLASCGQQTAGNQLEGTSWRDEGSDYSFVMRLQPDGVAEIDIGHGESVGDCTWQTSAEAVPDQSGPVITLECPRPMNSGVFRYDLAISSDLTTATRSRAIDDIRTQMFGVSSGVFDMGRNLTRFEE